jgi:hypothetical protein
MPLSREFRKPTSGRPMTDANRGIDHLTGIGNGMSAHSIQPGESSSPRRLADDVLNLKGDEKECGLYRRCSRCTNGFVQSQLRRAEGRSLSTGTFQTAQLGAVQEQTPHPVARSEVETVVTNDRTASHQPDSTGGSGDNSSDGTLVAAADDAQSIRSAHDEIAAGLKKTIRETEAALIAPMGVPKSSRVPRRGSDDPLVLADGPKDYHHPDDIGQDSMTVKSDVDDHSTCCPQCCKQNNCHGGCVGHQGASPSPVRVRALDSNLNSISGTITSLEGQPLTPLSERGKKLGLVKSAFKKGFQKSSSTTRDQQSPVLGARINHVTDLEGMPSELSGGPVSPSSRLGSKSSVFGASTAAAAAARSAIGSEKGRTDSLVPASLAAKAAMSKKANEPATPALQVRKSRSNSRALKADTDNGLAVENDKASKRVITPNEGRRVTSSHVQSESINEGYETRNGRKRADSGSSVSTFDMQMPNLAALGSNFGAVLDMALVPFNASKMWLRNNPVVEESGWWMIGRGGEMLLLILETGEASWRVAYVYSKTGKLRLPSKARRGGTKEGDMADSEFKEMTSPATFMWDCARSVLYTLIFLALGVTGVRMLKSLLSVAGVAFLMVKAMLWFGRVLLGGGILW